MKRSLSLFPMTPDLRCQPLGAASSSRARKSRSSALRLSAGVLAGRASFLSALNGGRPSYQENRGSVSKQQVDRSSFDKNLKHVITFLTENNYPYPLKKLNQSPAAKDVMTIFEFLVGLILPEYEITQKFEESFPVVLKMLRYPFTVTKRQLQPVGSMHNWPTIVAAFAWLVNAVKINRDLSLNSGMNDGMEQLSKSDILMQFHINAYKEFVLGKDDYEDMDRVYKENVPSMLGLENYKHIDAMTKEVESCNQLLAEINATNDELYADIANKKIDEEKINIYSQEMECYMKRMEDAKTILESELQKMKEEFSALVDDIAAKKTMVATQKVTVEEVKQLQEGLNGLNSELARHAQVASELNGEMIAEETEISKLKTEVGTIIEQYNATAISCQLIPATAENAQNFDYELTLSMVDGESCSHANDVDTRLDIIFRQFKVTARDMRSRELDFINTLEKYDATIISLKGDIADMERNLRCKEEAFELSKQEKADELQSLQSALNVGEEEISDIKWKLKISLNLEKTESDVLVLKKRNEDLERLISEKKKSLEVAMQSEFDKANQHIRKILERVAKFGRFAGNMKALFASLNKFRPLLNVSSLREHLDDDLEDLQKIKKELADK